jgi:hypothetical protein
MQPIVAQTVVGEVGSVSNSRQLEWAVGSLTKSRAGTGKRMLFA